MYEPRIYRSLCENKDLIQFNVRIKETDLVVLSNKNLKSKTEKIIRKYRTQLENYINRNNNFLTSLKSIPMDNSAPQIVKEMIKHTQKLGIGPMAAVAGAIAEFCGYELLKYTNELIIENGGDIFIKVNKPRYVGIYATGNPKFNKLAIEVSSSTPCGICTSSGTFGHSLSFGKADAVVTVAPSCIFADACATYIGNLVKENDDVDKALEVAKELKELTGIIIIKDDRIGIYGKIKLCVRNHINH